MLDFGLPELFLIIAIAVLAIGPGQAPKLLYQFGKFVNRLRGLRFALSRQFDHFMEECEAQDENTTPKKTSPYDPPDEAAFDEDLETQLDEPPTQTPENSRKTAKNDPDKTGDLFDNGGRS